MASFHARELAIAAELRTMPVRNICNLLFLCALTVGVMLNVPHSSPKGVSIYNHVADSLALSVGQPSAAPSQHSEAPALHTEPPAPPAASEFEKEAVMAPAALMKRWDPLIKEAARQFSIPAEWIRAVMRRESGGRTMLGEGRPIRSRAGAMGLMQIMRGTYLEMRARYGLGVDPYNPHDNVIAGAAYLRLLHRRYGFPAMFAVYNFGPGNYENHLQGDRPLPAETQTYVEGITANLARRGSGAAGAS